MTWRAATLGVALLSVVLGCNTTCERNTPGGEEVTYTGGVTLGDGAVQLYDTQAPEQPFLAFPPGRTFRLVHGLPAAPRIFQALLSFSSSGAGAAVAAGNQVIYGQVDDEFIQVRNDTCADFFLRVTAVVVVGEPESVLSEEAIEPASDAGL